MNILSINRNWKKENKIDFRSNREYDIILRCNKLKGDSQCIPHDKISDIQAKNTWRIQDFYSDRQTAVEKLSTNMIQ